MIQERLRENILLSDYSTIASIVPEGSRVLDLGCGTGELLARLIEERSVLGNGVEIEQDAVIECIHKGLSVFQGNIDEGLADYSDLSYDYVILNQTLQVIRRPDFVIEEMLRVGKRGIISFPNFGHWRVRLSLLWGGRMPRTTKLPFDWFNTPNIHLLTIRDFTGFCRDRGIHILQEINLRSAGNGSRVVTAAPNLLADEGLFVITRQTNA
jgi:methionine biosynthesis protein MetW